MVSTVHISIKRELEQAKIDKLVELLRSDKEMPPLVRSLIADMLEATTGNRLKVIKNPGGNPEANIARWFEVAHYRQNLIDDGMSKGKATGNTAEHFDISPKNIRLHVKRYEAGE